MPTPKPAVLARLCLVLVGSVCVIGMVGPFQGVEEALIPWDKAAHFLAFYGATALLFLAFPKRRRIDLTFMAAAAGAAIELAQALSGRDASVGDMTANALGACAVLGPSYIESVRAMSRGATTQMAFNRRKVRPLPAIGSVEAGSESAQTSG